MKRFRLVGHLAAAIASTGFVLPLELLAADAGQALGASGLSASGCRHGTDRDLAIADDLGCQPGRRGDFDRPGSHRPRRSASPVDRHRAEYRHGSRHHDQRSTRTVCDPRPERRDVRSGQWRRLWSFPAVDAQCQPAVGQQSGADRGRRLDRPGSELLSGRPVLSADLLPISRLRAVRVELLSFAVLRAAGLVEQFLLPL